MSDSISGFFSGGGKGITWPSDPPKTVSGIITVVHPPEEVLDPKDGRPTGRKQIRIGLQTDERDPSDPDDDGARTLYVKSYLRGAIGDALRKAGERNGPQVGAKLTVTFVRTEAPDRPGLSPSKHFECVYEKGAAGGGTDYYSGSTGATSAAEPVKPAGISDSAWAGMDAATRAKVADSMAPF